MLKTRGKQAGALVLAAGLVASFEGLRQNAYKDPVGIPTICFGETNGVRMGDHKSKEECNALLEGRLVEFYEGVRACVKEPLSDPEAAAFTSLAYNMGIGGFCRSSVVRLHNAGYRREACDRMLKFNTAGGIVFPGLTRRRQAERELCLQGVP